MNEKRRRRKGSDKFERDITQMIADYIAATGDTDWDRNKVALWAIANDRWERRKSNAVKELAKEISRVARTVTFVNENGDHVRRYHPWRLGVDQPTLWSPMETITPQNMNQSINSRREKLVNGAVKAIIDAEHFNKHHNPGEPIRVETDLTRDVNEKRQPGLYDDMPPDDSDEPDEPG